jgi:hypothetical protein
MSPTWYTIGLLGGLLGMFLARRFFVQPTVAWLMLNLSLWFMGASLTDPNFVKIVSKPDNVPIVGMVYLLGFFTWLSAYRAVQNDDRRARGELPLEAVDDEKTLVWPDLVYIELICMVAVTALADRLGHRPEGAAGGTGQRGAHAQSVEGPLVFPGPAGAAGLLRSLAGRRRAARL